MAALNEAERILAHIEAGHTEVYPFCDACRLSKDGVESRASGHGAVLVGHTQPHPDGGERDNVLTAIPYHKHHLLSDYSHAKVDAPANQSN